MKIKIIADSSSNMPKYDGISYTSVPLHIIVGNKDFVDDDTIRIVELQSALDEYKGKTSTSCPSVDDWICAFDDADYIFCVTITSNLSGACNSANMAKQMYEAEHVGKKVYVIDSLSTGPEMVLLIEKINELIEMQVESIGKTIQEIDASEFDADTINEAVREYAKHTHLYFSLSSLDNLAKNGRINPIIAKGIGLLGIRVVGKASDEGTLQPLDKCRGDRKAFSCLVNHMKKCNYVAGKIVISHSNNQDGVNALVEQIKECFGTVSYKIMENTALCHYYAEPNSILIGFEA